MRDCERGGEDAAAVGRDRDGVAGDSGGLGRPCVGVGVARLSLLKAGTATRRTLRCTGELSVFEENDILHGAEELCARFLAAFLLVEGWLRTAVELFFLLSRCDKQSDGRIRSSLSARVTNPGLA